MEQFLVDSVPSQHGLEPAKKDDSVFQHLDRFMDNLASGDVSVKGIVRELKTRVKFKRNQSSNSQVTPINILLMQP